MPEFQQQQFGFSIPPQPLPQRKAPLRAGHREDGLGSLDPHRENYPHADGQTVMGVHDLSVTHVLDRHGNVDETDPRNRRKGLGQFEKNNNVASHGWYEKHTAGMSAHNEAQWQARSTVRRLRIDTVLHTGQSANATGSHRDIAGPLRPHTYTDIALDGGVPYIADGHHRLAEARGRGETHFEARIRDLDAERKAVPTVAKPAKKDIAGIRAHLINDHGIHPDDAHDHPLFATGVVGQRHDVLHRQQFPEHKHGPVAVADPAPTAPSRPRAFNARHDLGG